jgi:hypothetical protein
LEMVNLNPVNRLSKIWLSIDGVSRDKNTYGFIGKLYKTYGEEILLQAFEIIQNRPTQANNISDPQRYLRGICKNILLQIPSQRGRGIFESMMKDVFGGD